MKCNNFTTSNLKTKSVVQNAEYFDENYAFGSANEECITMKSFYNEMWAGKQNCGYP